MSKPSCLFLPWRWFLITFVFFFAFLTSFTVHSQTVPNYLLFSMNATEFPPDASYDYVIVGGGTAGCPLVATLSQNFTVLLIERGGVPYGNPNLMNLEGFLPTLMQVDEFDSPAQSFTSEDGVPNARGRVLGGSSAINAGFYSRADHEFYEQSGISWDMRLVNMSYEWVERMVVSRLELRNWQSAFRDSLLEAGIGPYNGFTLDHVVGTKIGGSTFDGSGRRHSAADLLSCGKTSNMRVALYANAERILISASDNSELSATGVVFRDDQGNYHRALVKGGGEVILTAGAIGTPQLMLLSGIGSRPYLSSWGIPVSLHSPHVGQFMYDNSRNGISIVPPVPIEHSLIQVVGITGSGTYIEAASNVIPFITPAHSIFLRAPSMPLYLAVATIMEKISGPSSSGTLVLASTDVRVNPIVRFNYFSDPSDLQKCVNGVRTIGAMLSSRSLEDFRFRQWSGEREFRFVGPSLPRDLSDDALMADYCRRSVSTLWHYHGGCLVGKVVDADLRVLGINALRVVDGSVLTVSPGTNPQATLMMLGRYMGAKLVNERSRPK
ncbi:(R)-mandelonitrile lyase-like-like protein, partial [Drosera capensis]